METVHSSDNASWWMSKTECRKTTIGHTTQYHTIKHGLIACCLHRRQEVYRVNLKPDVRRFSSILSFMTAYQSDVQDSLNRLAQYFKVFKRTWQLRDRENVYTKLNQAGKPTPDGCEKVFNKLINRSVRLSLGVFSLALGPVKCSSTPSWWRDLSKPWGCSNSWSACASNIEGSLTILSNIYLN